MGSIRLRIIYQSGPLKIAQFLEPKLVPPMGVVTAISKGTFLPLGEVEAQLGLHLGLAVGITLVLRGSGISQKE